ncbi:hypothetical protein NESM_000782900 [Novymonas esmeraldas]|uniref:Uncharacterized protein n=1 Tax=Novymonas esmeraldas TaxID=1808958 RepID=A0AAW0EXF4_9TRYP
MRPSKRTLAQSREAQPEAAAAFDPVAYAASIAITAAEKRLRASHVRAVSSSTTHSTTSARRTAKGASAHAPVSRTSLRGEAASGTAAVRATAAAHPAPPAARQRTLLEELASASESGSSVDAALVPTPRTGAAPLSHVVSSYEHSRSASVRSPSPPAPPSRDAHEHSARPVAHAVPVPPSPTEEPQDADAAVLLRDASPLREHRVRGGAGMRYRVSTVESVHSVAHQLNFSLYL